MRPAGPGAGAHRHAAGQQRAARRAHRRTAEAGFLRGREVSGAGRAGEGRGLQSITNLIVRRRYGAGPTIALNAHGDVVPPAKAGPTALRRRGADGKLYGRAAAVSKSDFATFIFATRALESLGAPLLRAASSCTSPTTRSSAASSAPAGCWKTGLTKPDLLIAAGFSYQVVTAHNGCLQLEVTVHGLPGARRHSRHRRRRAAGRHRHPQRAVCAEHALQTGQLQVAGITTRTSTSA